MLQTVRDWLSKSPNQQSVIERLNKESVRNHRNMRVAGEGGAPASQGSFAEQEGHQLQQAVMGHIPGIGLLPGNAKGLEGGSPEYPSRPGGYPQAGGQQHGGFASPPGYPSGPMGGEHQHGGHQHGGHQHGGHQHGGHQHGGHQHGGHQHGGDRYGSISTYTPPAAAPSLSTTFPMGGGPPTLPSPHSGPAHHPGSTGPHIQYGGYGPPSFPSGSPSFPGGGDGFSFPESFAPSFPGGDGVSFPDSRPSFPGAPFPDGPPVGGYNPYGGGGHHAHHAPPGPPPNYGGGAASSPGHFEFPTANQYPDGYNPSYQGGGW